MEERNFLVLIIGEHADAAAVYGQALASATGSDFVVETSASGRDALRLCLDPGRPAPDCVVLDSRLQDMTGMEFVRRLGAATGRVPIPLVIVLESDRDGAAAREAIRAGAQECLLRSNASGAALVLAVRSAIARFGMSREDGDRGRRAGREEPGTRSHADLVSTRSRTSDSAPETPSRGGSAGGGSSPEPATVAADPDLAIEGPGSSAGEDRYRLACEAVSGLLYDWDLRTGRVERSSGLFDVTGYRPEEATPSDRWWAERVHPDDLPEGERRFREVVSARRPLHQAEYRIRHRDGTIRHVWDRARVVYDAEGCVTRVVGNTIDITDRVRTEAALRESERRFRTLATSDCIGIVVGGVNGELSYVNDEYLRILGYSREEFQARPFRWTDVTPPEWLEIDRRKIADVWAGLSCAPYEKEYVRRDGGRVPVLLGFAIPSDGEGEMIAFVLDLTERKRTERALKDADRRKNEFIAMLAHELRNPLAAISTAVHILRMKGPDLPELSWGREVIGRQVKQLTRLIDDLLDVSRIATGKIRLKKSPVDLREVVDRAVDSVRPLITSREHELRVEKATEPLTADADPARLEQVVTNLLSNAAKFTECGGKLSLCSRREDRQVVIRVRDNGVGIAPEVRPYIFNLFAQVDAGADRTQGGLGIGLTLVKSLVEMHGGSVEVASEGVGKGTEFTIRIPCIEAAVEEAGADSDSDGVGALPLHPGDRSRVLVVDDNEDVVHGLAKLIETAGHEVKIAHDGPDALRIAREFLPEYVLTDIGLPGMDGYELAKAFRLEVSLRRATLIAISGYGQMSDRSRSRAAGFDHHLLKPVEPSSLLSLLTSSSHAVE